MSAPEHEKFGKYTLLDRIGRGGMAEVFLAKTEGIEGFERKVALKRIFSSLTSTPEFVQSFIHEARIGGMLYHHNVVQTLDFGRFGDRYYIALEYVQGTNLGRLFRRCRDHGVAIPPPLFLQIAVQLCEGLDYIHKAQIEGTDLQLVHRDVKPSNMLITAQGLVKITDFGVVKASASLGGRTIVGSVKGTIGYMSPEQARGDEVTGASDLYSLGTLLFEMATLQRLYGEGDEMTILKRVIDSDFQLPLELAGAFIPGLDRVLKRLLKPEIEYRYSDAGEVSAALRALPVAMGDRATLVAFVESLGLFDGPQEATESREAPVPRAQLFSTPSPPPPIAAPTFGVVPQPEGSLSWPQMIALGVLIAILGLAAALGSYHLVKSQLDARWSTPGNWVSDPHPVRSDPMDPATAQVAHP